MICYFQSHVGHRLWSVVLSFANPDPESGTFLTLDPGFGMGIFGSGIRNGPGSATLAVLVIL
jgi:hypothetical protein